ncbi:ABC transporter substrate-binding protein [Kribbella sp. NPDC050459]|uniref:ABC transporter substrate-binding protein n=1 Tax=Kribbella sp. NPDC050459 TaxID=3155785 RepID=UPI003410CDB6
MTKRRRSVAWAGVSVLALSLAACGGTADPAGTSAGGQITVWSMWSEGEYGQRFLQRTIEDFTKETGIKVTVAWKGRGVDKAILPTLNTPNPPADVVEGGVQQIAESLGETGGILDLSDVYAAKVPGEDVTVAEVVGKYKSSAQPMDGTGTLGAVRAVPYWLSADGIWYNSAVFPELKTAPPKTWDEFKKLLDSRKAAGRRPLAVDGSIPAYNWRYYDAFVRSLAGDGAVVKAATDKTGQTWRQPAYLKAAKHVEELAKGDYFVEGFEATKFPAVENMWADNQSDFIVMGSWLPAEVQPVLASGFEPSVFPFPGVDGQSAPKSPVVADGFGIVSKSENIEAAKKFVAYLVSEKVQRRVASEMNQFPLRAGAEAPKGMAALKTFLDDGGVSESRYPAGMSDWRKEVFASNDDQLIFGKITAEEFVEQMATGTASYWKSHK